MQCWIAVTQSVDGATSGGRGITSYSYETDNRSKKHVAAGDVLFLRDDKRLIAVAQAEDVVVEKSEQLILRCPVCDIGRVEFRKKGAPSYRCSHGHQFSTPAETREATVVHSVHFPHATTKISARIESAELRPFELTNSRHIRLKLADLIGLCGYVARRDHTVLPILKSWLRNRNIELGDREADHVDGNALTVVDEQDKPFHAIRVRRGIATFRDKLISRYGARCMISGSSVLSLLEACHVSRYQGPQDNHPANGILLRSDLHTLFDLDLIGINPTDMAVTVHPVLATTEYQKFAGVRLVLDGEKAIDMRAVRARWEQFVRKLADVSHKIALSALGLDVLFSRLL